MEVIKLMNQIEQNKITASVYHHTLPSHKINIEKSLLLHYFCEGVNKCDDIVVAHKHFNALPCDVALIQGYSDVNGKTTPHLKLRRDIIELQKQNNKKILIADSSLFLYLNKDNPQHYLRYSLDGVFPTTGFYFDTEIDPNRWIKISKNLNITLKPYKNQGSYILICLQRNGGWSMSGVVLLKWLQDTINKIKLVTDRLIVIRPHPKDKKIMTLLKSEGYVRFLQPQIQNDNVRISSSPSLLSDLRNAWATVVYNSSPSVASVIEGVPTFITDPEPNRSQSYGVANIDLTKIETPVLYERQKWVEKLSMCHWNFDELRSGEAWSFFKKFI